MLTTKKVVEKCGAAADLERALPCLYRVAPDGAVKEAVLDFAVTSPGCFQISSLDVTIRCQHGVGHAQCQPAVAAEDSELEKTSRHNKSLAPIPLETYGRMGVASMAGLRQLALSLNPVSMHGPFRSPRDLLATDG